MADYDFFSGPLGSEQQDLVDLTTEDDSPAPIRGVRSTYTYNHEETGEKFLHELKHARGTDLIGVLLARSHSTKDVDYESPLSDTVRLSGIDAYDSTIHWRLKEYEPRPEVILQSKHELERDSISYSDLGSGMGLLGTRTYDTGRGKHTSVVQSVENHKGRMIEAAGDNNAAKQGLQPSRDDSVMSAYKAADLPSGVPDDVVQLIANIEAAKRNKQGYPFRYLLSDCPEFNGHFNRTTGRLRSDSPLRNWFGDTRIFSMDWWDYLKGAKLSDLGFSRQQTAPVAQMY